LKHISIRSRIIVLFSLAMIAASVATYYIVLFISSSVMQKTIRSYLTGTVEANTDKLTWNASALTGQESEEDPDDIFLSYQKGHIQIDDDFLDVMHNVEAGLYTGDGTMLYGKNPIPQYLAEEPFTETRIYSLKTEKETFYVYDRRLTGDLRDLWIRGAVPLSPEMRELTEIRDIVFLFLPALILAAVVLGILAARDILRPIREIERTAADISGGTDLEKRLPKREGRDEIVSLTDTFNGMLDRLEHSFEVEQQFSSDASHELRTPLSVIMAQTELTLEKERTPEEYREALTVIRRQGNRMQTLVADMLDYTRLQQSPGRYPMEDFNLSDLVLTVSEDMKMIGVKSIALDAFAEPDIHITGNRMLISRLLQNLIDNAYKYGREDGYVHVKLVREGEALLLSVEDNGIGIPESAKEHIFRRFYRVDASRRRGGEKGYGLGLSIAAKIAELHGAEMAVESQVDRGSTFKVIWK